MTVSKITPRQGFLVVRQRADERVTGGGVMLRENEDDFVVHGEVVAATAASEFSAGQSVVYHVLDGALGFFDGGEKFAFVEEDKVLGTYGGNE